MPIRAAQNHPIQLPLFGESAPFPACHPERSEAESKDLGAAGKRTITRRLQKSRR